MPDPKPLTVVMDNKDDIPAEYQPLYSEQNGKFVLTGVGGVKTQADIDRIQTGLTKERDEHSKTKNRLRFFVEMDDTKLQDAQAWLDKRQEVETQLETAGKTDEEKVNKLVESRINTMKAPLEREKAELATKLDAATKEVTTLQEEKRVRTIHDAVRALRADSKYRDSAEDDILMLAERMLEIGEDGVVKTKDGVGVVPGLPVKEWLAEMQPKKPHWWPDTQGGGAPGGKPGTTFSDNPWTFEHWNKTKQAQIISADEKKAEQMARQAGVDVWATRPRQPK